MKGRMQMRPFSFGEHSASEGVGATLAAASGRSHIPPAPRTRFASTPGLRLGFRGQWPNNRGMEIKSDNPDHGFKFPGTFELSAMGAADKGLESELPRLLADAGIEVLHETIAWKHSSSGKYVSVRISFHAGSREQYEAAHNALRVHPEVKWTI